VASNAHRIGVSCAASLATSTSWCPEGTHGARLHGSTTDRHGTGQHSNHPPTR
jgi:hypothetical protein